jgi:hypothetical protein
MRHGGPRIPFRLSDLPKFADAGVGAELLPFMSDRTRAVFKKGKSEIRMSKSETNSKLELGMFKTARICKSWSLAFCILNLFRISDFDIRIFDFSGGGLE